MVFVEPSGWPTYCDATERDYIDRVNVRAAPERSGSTPAPATRLFARTRLLLNLCVATILGAVRDRVRCVDLK